MIRRLGALRHPALNGHTTLNNCTYTWTIHPFTGALSINSTTTPAGTTHFRARRIAALSPSPLDEGPYTVELLDKTGQLANFGLVEQAVHWALDVLTAGRSDGAPQNAAWGTAAACARSALLHGSQVLHSSWGDNLELAWTLTGRRGVVVTEIHSPAHSPENVRILAGHLEGVEPRVFARDLDGELLPAAFPDEREAGAYLAGRAAYGHSQCSETAA